MKLKEALKGKLSKKELEIVVGGFDLIGSVAVIEIPKELEKKKKLISDTLLKIHKNIDTVLLKKGKREGNFRLREFEILHGKSTEIIHKENSCRIKLDVRTCYFSPREGTERERISKFVAPGENVLVMFAGVAPFSVEIAKRQPLVGKIYSIEINPDCQKYAIDNVKLNKVEGKVIPINSDVSEFCKTTKERFDRVVMPLPKEGYKFLEDAISCLKKKGIIHFYHYSHENDLWDETIGLINDTANKLDVRTRILNKRKVLSYGPKVYKVCVDFEVKK